jgi:hypothetical protein
MPNNRGLKGNRDPETGDFLEENKEDFPEIMKEIKLEYPKVSEWGMQVVDKRKEKQDRDIGQLEFFHPEDSGPPDKPNPYFGTPTIEVYNPELKGEDLKRAILGDMLHYAPFKNSEFNELRDELRTEVLSGEMSERNKIIDTNAYKRAKKQFNEKRPYEKWFEISRLDAYIRGKLAPDRNNSWKDSYTPKQLGILEKMEKSLK